MRLDPPLRDAPRYPVTSVILLGAIGVSLYWWAGNSIDAMLPSAASLARQPWRLATAALPHINLPHLAFNLYWWWRLATRIERAWGGARLIGLTLLLAVVSTAAEFTLFGAGVGLSGVVYGRCGLLYISQQAVPALEGSVSRKAAETFVAWFVLCILLTATGVMRVANVSHAAGALAGLAIGCAIVAGAGRRTVWIAGTGVFTLVMLAGAMLGRPWLNLSRYASPEAVQGFQALSAGRSQAAVPLLEIAVGEVPRDAGAWVNLGIAYQNLGRHQDALTAYKKAAWLDATLTSRLSPSISSLLLHIAHDAGDANDLGAARKAAEESLRWNDHDEYAWRVLGATLARAGDIEGGLRAYGEAKGRMTPERLASPAFRAQIAEEVGVLQANAKRHDLAAEQFRMALADDPENGRLWLLLAHELEAAESLDLALEAYDRAAGHPEQAADAKARAEAIRESRPR